MDHAKYLDDIKVYNFIRNDDDGSEDNERVRVPKRNLIWFFNTEREYALPIAEEQHNPTPCL